MLRLKSGVVKKMGMGFLLTAILTGVLGAGMVGRVTALPSAPQAGSLQNPGFDNHRWYEFNDRYGNWLTKSWVPDDDDEQRKQDWRLWYMRNTPVIQSFAESEIVVASESVALRSYDGNLQEGGLYQKVYGVTPCLLYSFQMYALTRPDDDVPDKTAVLKVGIDPTGWATDPAVDPAFPGYYPDTIEWGVAQDYRSPNFGALSAVAEARSTQITVFTYGYFHGGTKNVAVWDSGSLADVTPAMIHPITSLPAPGGVSNVAAVTVGDMAQISWTTPDHPAVSQIYYLLKPQGGGIPVEYPNKIYLPMLIAGLNVSADWMASSLNKTATESHTVNLSGLLAGRTYEYIALSRGLGADGQCTTWVSEVQEFTMP